MSLGSHGRAGLACLNTCKAGRELKPTTQMHLSPLKRRVVRLGGTPRQEQSWEGTLYSDCVRLSDVPRCQSSM